MKGNARAIRDFNTVTDKEMQILITVINKYNLQILRAEKIRSAFKIITNNGQFYLKRMRHGRDKVKNGCILAKELQMNKFTNTAKYIRTNEGTYSVRYKKNIFYLTEWIEGCECDLTNIDEAVNCTILLAQFHNMSNKIDHSKIRIDKNLKNWPKILASNINNLEKFKRIINGKRMKNDFDVLFLENIDSFYNRGLSAINMLNKSQYYKLAAIANEGKTICHNSFYYQNIIKKEEEYFIIDFDSIIIDLQISDLGMLIRRLMFKRAYGWNFYFAKTIIEAYNSISRLSKEELEVMVALIIFPQKFWKLGQRRYIKQKKWSESKYLHKLNKIISYNEMQEKFLNDYLIFLEKYI